MVARAYRLAQGWPRRARGRRVRPVPSPLRRGAAAAGGRCRGAGVGARPAGRRRAGAAGAAGGATVGAAGAGAGGVGAAAARGRWTAGAGAVRPGRAGPRGQRPRWAWGGPGVRGRSVEVVGQRRDWADQTGLGRAGASVAGHVSGRGGRPCLGRRAASSAFGRALELRAAAFLAAGRLLRRLGLFRLDRASEALGVGLAADAVGLGLLDGRRVALHTDSQADGQRSSPSLLVRPSSGPVRRRGSSSASGSHVLRITGATRDSRALYPRTSRCVLPTALRSTAGAAHLDALGRADRLSARSKRVLVARPRSAGRRASGTATAPRPEGRNTCCRLPVTVADHRESRAAGPAVVDAARTDAGPSVGMCALALGGISAASRPPATSTDSASSDGSSVRQRHR